MSDSYRLLISANIKPSVCFIVVYPCCEFGFCFKKPNGNNSL